MAMYLYEAIAEVLRAGGNIPMTIGDLAESINNQGLYFKKDGAPIGSWNVGIRTVADVSKSGVPMFDVLVKLRDKQL